MPYINVAIFIFVWLASVRIIISESESESEVAQWCPILCNPMDCSLPGSSVHGIFQARILEWVAISFSRGSGEGPRDWTWVFHVVGRGPSILLLWVTFSTNNFHPFLFIVFYDWVTFHCVWLLRWLSGKESACQCRRHRCDLWVRKIPWRRKWQPTSTFCLENPMDRGA